jgi:hypothetical protein
MWKFVIYTTRLLNTASNNRKGACMGAAGLQQLVILSILDSQ